jgi:arylsulfatase A
MDKLIGRVVEKLDELEIRENTLVIFLGDNGTGHQITSQFKGQPYPGGKGQTNARGTHVPLIVNWPARIAEGSVNSDLVSSTDFLPTLCAAAGAKMPSTMPPDGRSFLPQLLDQKGRPREWHYSWYAKGTRMKEVSESAMTKEHKLYRDGRFYNLASDAFEERPSQLSGLSGKEAAAADKLAKVLEQYANARPAEVTAAAAKAASEEKNQKPKRPSRRRAGRQSAAADAANPSASTGAAVQ